MLASAVVLLAVPAFAQAPATPPPATPPPTTPPATPTDIPSTLPTTTPSPLPGAAGVQQNPSAPVPSWLPKQAGDLRALDKVSAGVTPFTLRVGQGAHYGSLTIFLRACLVRPPNQPADAAAYLDITDSRDSAVGFHGWMFVGEPEVSMLEHPVYDIRLTGCHD